MKKHISLLLLAGALTWGACDKAMEDNLPSEFASVLYFDLKDGKNIIDCNLLKTGDKGQYTFYVGKGGNQLGTTAEAELMVLTKDELEEYNENNNSNYALLPPEYYSFAGKLSFTGEDMRKGVDVMFETTNMDNELEVNKQYVLPIRLESQTNTVNKELNLLIVKPFISTPIVTLDLPAYQKISMNITMPEVTSQTIIMPFFVDLNENKWNFSVELEKEESVLQVSVDEYKQNNLGTDTYQLLPSTNYTMPSFIVFNEGELLVTENLVIDRGNLTEGNYLLPIKLKKCVGTDFDVDTKTMYVHLSLNQDLPEIELTKEMLEGSTRPEMNYQWNSGNHPVELMIDDNVNTFYQSEWTKYTTPGDSRKPHDETYGLYVDIKLSKPLQCFVFEFCGYQTSKGSDQPNPKNIDVWVGNGDSLEKIDQIKDIPSMHTGGEFWKSDNYSRTSSFTHIRLSVMNNQEAGKNLWEKTNSSIVISELKIYGR